MNRSDILLMVILIGIVIFGASIFAHMAYGELSVIEGFGDNAAITIDFENSEATLYTRGEITDFSDLNVKYFKSGGFAIKNTEAGIVIFGHPTGDQYKLFILTGDRSVYRIVADVTTMNTPTVTETIEPKSSVGSDISKWDIPTEGRRDKTIIIPETEWDEDSLSVIIQSPSNVQHKHDFIFSLTAIDTQIVSEKDQRLGEVIVNASIFNPIGERVESWTGNTTQFGYFGEKIHILDNQMIGEYTLEVSLEKEKFNPISKMVSFFVIPIDDNGRSKPCPELQIWNGTQCIKQEVNE